MINTESKDLAAGRLEKLRQIVRERRIVRVDELVAGLGVSAPTVRRDLVQLESHGDLRRVHGYKPAPYCAPDSIDLAQGYEEYFDRCAPGSYRMGG